MLSNVDIIVLTSPHRNCSVSKLLDVPHKVYTNEDWEFEELNYTYDSCARVVCSKQTLCFRCFRGHQEALKLATKPYILMLEDDAVPKPGWKETVKKCIPLLGNYDLVQLFCGGLIVDQNYKLDYLHYRTVGTHNSYGLRWATGSVAYLTSKRIAKDIIHKPYVGLPMDIWMNNKYNSICLSEESQCFGHDETIRSHFGH